jgi:hypothetical protein
MAAHISADGEGLTRSAQSAAQSAMRGRLGRQHHATRQRTITKVGKSDCEGTFARVVRNDENAPFPAVRASGSEPSPGPRSRPSSSCVRQVQQFDHGAG